MTEWLDQFARSPLTTLLGVLVLACLWIVREYVRAIRETSRELAEHLLRINAQQLEQIERLTDYLSKGARYVPIETKKLPAQD